MARLILDMLRDAPEPMTAKDMAKLILTAKGEDAGEPKRVEAVIQRVLGTLGGTRLRGWWRAETFQCIVTDTRKNPDAKPVVKTFIKFHEAHTHAVDAANTTKANTDCGFPGYNGA
jgi:hypothetical protein